MDLPKSFNDLIRQSERPVLVDFWADWCGPCRTIAPAIAQIARDYKGKLLVVKINVDEKPYVANQFGVRSIPTIILFRDGRPIMQQQGAVPYETLKQKIDRAMMQNA